MLIENFNPLPPSWTHKSTLAKICGALNYDTIRCYFSIIPFVLLSARELDTRFSIPSFIPFYDM